MNPTDQEASETPAPTYRSRSGRFAPSMGWKAFWSEIIIVVLGVMIALAANEVVENWNWQNKVREGELRLRGDMDANFFYAAEINATLPCVNA